METDNSLREVIPFYIFMSLLLVVIAIAGIYNAPLLENSQRLALFLLLMVVHIAAHWLSPFAIHRRIWWLYVGAQGAISLFILAVSGMPELMITLLAVLIGEAVGVLGNTRVAALNAVFYIIIITAGLYFFTDLQVAVQLLGATAPTVIFVTLAIVLYNRQRDAREKAQELLAELEAANRQLASYAAQVEDLTLSAERQRMARELHDTLAQGVAGLILQLEAVQANLEIGRTERAIGIIYQAMVRARGTLAESRAAIDDLRAQGSPDLSEAVRQYVERFQSATGIPCRLEVELGNLAEQGRLPASVVEHAQRIVSEALANIARHAQASQVTVHVACLDDALTLEISDDGVGFDPQAVAQSGHYGLLGIRERVRLSGGSLSIQSQPGAGTKIISELPFRAAGENQ